MRNYFYAALILGLVACSRQETTTTETSTVSTATETTATQLDPAAATTTMTTETTATVVTTATTVPAPAVTVTTAKREKKPMDDYTNKVAELHTSKGEIDIRFFSDVAPGHVKNFIDLAKKGFYDGTKFHRIIPGFMVQGGDPNTISGNPNTWGMGGSSQQLPAEFNTVSHKRGIVSMARSSDPNSASSQFFVVVKDSTFLDRQYTAFGQVTKGMDVADQIVNAPRGAQDRPNDPVSIQKIVIRDARADEKGATPK